MEAHQGYKKVNRKLFILAKDFVQVFESTPRIQVSMLTTVFAQKLRKNIRLRDYDCSGVVKLVEKLPIFDQHEGAVSLNQSKVLQFFFCPVLQSRGGSVLVEDVPTCFKETTGLDVQFLYDFTGVTSLHEFVKHLLRLCHDIIQQEREFDSGLQSLTLRHFDRSVSTSGWVHALSDAPSLEIPPPTKKARLQQTAPCKHSTFGERDVPLDYPMPGHPPADHVVRQKHPLLLTPPHPGAVPVPAVRQVVQYRPHPDPLPRPPGVPVVQQLQYSPSQSHPDPLPRPPGVPVQQLRFNPSPSHPDPLPRPPGVPVVQQLQFSPSPSHPDSLPHPPAVSVVQQCGPSPPPPSFMKPVTAHTQLATSCAVRSETFPNSDKDELVANKPCHPRFRPNMEVPSLPMSPLKAKRTKMDKQWVNSTLQAMIEELSLNGKFLPTYKVWDLLQNLLRQSGRAISSRDIPAWSEFSKTHGRVEELIKVFCRMSPITSLYELEQAIMSTESVENYEALHLGPLLRHPLVQDFFKPPRDLESIPDITSFKIYKHLSDFINKRSRRDGQQSLEEFLEYMQKKEMQESVYHLCVRITSFPLAIQVLHDQSGVHFAVSDVLIIVRVGTHAYGCVDISAKLLHLTITVQTLLVAQSIILYGDW